MATSTPPAGPTNLGVAPNVGGLLCYVPCCIGLIFSIVVVIVEKQSRFLRFHAFQSLLFHGVLIVISIALQIFGMILSAISGALGLILIPIEILLGLALLAFNIWLMVKAYNNEEYEIPTLGQMARNWA
jgi:uncharacterized membrane protein